jgi:hypothetical protein
VSKVNVPPGGPKPPPGAATPHKPTQLLRARNAAGKQAHSALGKSGYQRPHRVHTEGDEAAAFERHRQALLDEEAHKNSTLEVDPALQVTPEEAEEQRLKGINFDEDRKKRGKRKQDDDDDDREDGEAAAAAAQAAAEKGFATDAGAGKYFQDAPLDRLGDLSLTDPNDMKGQLGPSVRFAQHAMMLAETRMKEGATRDEALAFLASLYVGVTDKAYANKALREFGAATGILDLYPAELMQHLLEHVPGFCSKVQQGSFFTQAGGGAYRAKAHEPITLTYDPELRIRGFALKGGGRPGYLFEPIDPPGTYQLTFFEAGKYVLLISAIKKNGWLMVDEIACEISAGEAADLPKAVQREREEEGPADASAEASPEPEPKKQDLTIHFPKRI